MLDYFSLNFKAKFSPKFKKAEFLVKFKAEFEGFFIKNVKAIVILSEAKNPRNFMTKCLEFMDSSPAVAGSE